MERSQLFDLMGELKLYGMKAAFDEIMATAVKRQHEPQRIVGDLLNAEINEKQARSIKYQLTIAKFRSPRTSTTSSSRARPSTRHSCVTSPAASSSLSSATPCWSAGPAPARPIWPLPSPETASVPALVAGSTTWSTSSTGSRSRPATEGKVGLPINSLEWTSSFSTSSAICHSLNPEGSSYSTSSVASMSAPQSLSPPISHSVNGRASSVIPR